jgi:hypothetical protein
MLEVYSLNTDVAANAVVPFQNVSLQKGCTAELSGVGTIKLNKCGVYMVAVDATTSAVTTIQLYKDGIAQPQAQSTGQSLSFTTLVQVDKNNTACPCSEATVLRLMNETAATFDNINVTVTKIV